ncbi:BspA family leucine-rich repeat surface protein [Campylobacter sp. CNRCH_2015_1657]|uniref:BspA family leucine-rich repeat surface protein n=1 Tax=Campylobacter sp. CNRCH_2015_1657 TaxID=2911607 RepID=UPI0021E63E2F|nr:BspA family leucine-rich repeat surface protein [Campylobacter sp. CNRCH_2015_1657]MCV3479463.1 BspA family leucine-rich repeat surface protein [Campylobacter sp. CNRCH_2015_1657]
MSYANKIQSIIQELNKGLLERDEVIKLVLLAFFSGKSIFLYGPPGTAKSMIARRSALAFGEDNHFFTYLMNRFSTPEEVFGPIDIKALKENKLKRVTKGYLPCANFAFLDEIWKSSPAILNTLLTIINEKIYKDGEDNIEVPLYGLICASNEFPATNQGLEALYDRMLIRYEVLPLEQRESFENLLRNKSEKIMIKNHFQAEELQKILIESENVEFPDEAMEILLNIKSDIELHNQNLEDIDELIYISDRRYKSVAELLAVCAYLNDRKEILPIDLALLEHCLWSNEKDKKIIKQILQENFTHEVDEKEFLRVKNILLALEDEINKACYRKQIEKESKDFILSKLQRIQKEFLSLKQNLEDEFNQLKNKNKNIFLSEYSYKTFFASYDELFKAIKQELLKTEQIQYNLNASKEVKKIYKYKPKNKTELKQLVKNINIILSDINISNITDMSGIFKNSKRRNFSGIEKWDVSKVTNMSGMFSGVESFNHDISNWNVSKVTNMSHMFYKAVKFNQPLYNWDVSSVKNMEYMFANATHFNQPLYNWDVSNVTNMSRMFSYAKSFNRNLNQWNVAKLKNRAYMFAGSAQNTLPHWYKG